MGRSRFTPLAKQDLKEISRFIALEYPEAARRFLASVKQQCKTLSDFPEMGRLWQELDPPLRSFPVGNYLIFYRPAGVKAIEVIAVVSGFRDLEMFFEQRLGS
jgi:toxin ParE1/3/4